MVWFGIGFDFQRYCSRYHSFYPWHEAGDYANLASDTDKAMLPWLKKMRHVALNT